MNFPIGELMSISLPKLGANEVLSSSSLDETTEELLDGIRNARKQARIDCRKSLIVSYRLED